ncbi:hypothetical protein AX16_010739 [Volvariella volvacea WC 439]|nr:hypothetical protein AX16_010739 [Volvariella volvacea WC 439]
MVQVINRDTNSNMCAQWQRSHYGPQSAINELPTEMLTTIFMFAKSYGVFPEVLSQVCQRWRSITTSVKDLWTEIFAGPMYPLGLAESRLQRSSPRPIEFILDLYYPNAPGVNEYWRRKSLAEFGDFNACRDSWIREYKRVFNPEQLQRCRSISVEGHGCHAILAARELLGFMSDYSAPHLERFKFDTRCQPRECNRYLPWLMESYLGADVLFSRCVFALDEISSASCFRKGAPNLTTVSLSGLSIGNVILDSSHVTSLTLSENSCFNGSRHLDLVLSRFENLETLHLHGNVLGNWLSDRTVPPSTLKKLKTLKFSGEYLNLHGSLSRLSILVPEHLILDPFWPEYLGEVVEASTEDWYSHLKKLTLRVDGQLLGSPRNNPFITESTRYPIGISYPDLGDTTDIYRVTSYRQAIRDISCFFPNVEDLVISELLVNQVASALAPLRGVIPHVGTPGIHIAWRRLMTLRVEASMPHWMTRTELREMKRQRKQYGVPVPAVRMDYRNKRRSWDTGDMAEELERSRL